MPTDLPVRKEKTAAEQGRLNGAYYGLGFGVGLALVGSGFGWPKEIVLGTAILTIMLCQAFGHFCGALDDDAKSKPKKTQHCAGCASEDDEGCLGV